MKKSFDEEPNGSITSPEYEDLAPPDPFLEMLPHLLDRGKPETQEPAFQDLPKVAQKRYLEQLDRRNILAEQGRLATGSGVVILVSELGYDEVETQFEGVEQPFIHIEYNTSGEERDEHFQAADSIKHRIEQITHNGVTVSIELATMESIEKAIFDPEVAHLIFIGHANRAKLAVGVGPEDSFNWDDPKKPIDHLKLSFGVFGCGQAAMEGPRPRVGSSFVAPNGILYGVKGDYFEEGQRYEFDQLIPLPSSPLPGTPGSQELSVA